MNGNYISSIERIKWFEAYLTELLKEDYVKQEWYKNIAIVYTTKDAYNKVCALKEAILETVSYRFPEVSIRFRRV